MFVTSLSPQFVRWTIGKSILFSPSMLFKFNTLFYNFFSPIYGPSIKYVRSDGGRGIKLKAYTYCLKRYFLLCKIVHGGGVRKVLHWSVRTLWIGPPYITFSRYKVFAAHCFNSLLSFFITFTGVQSKLLGSI